MTEADKTVSQLGSCHCGEVKFKVEGKIAFSALCHCTFCVGSRGVGPLHVMGVAPETSVVVTNGKENLVDFVGKVVRTFCKKCGCLVHGVLKGSGIMFVCPLNFHLETEGAPHNGTLLLPPKFRPQAHVNYESRLWDWQDSLPKFKGLGFACPVDNRGVEAGQTLVQVKEEGASDGMVNEKGSCFCGTVKFTVQGKQIFSVLCHCRDCTRNRGTGPVLVVGVVPPTAVQCTEGQDAVTTVDEARSFCSKCGSAVWNAKKGTPFVCAFPASFGILNAEAPNNGARLLPVRFRPTAHINYESRMFDQEDSLPKFKGFAQQGCLLTNAGDEVNSEAKAASGTSSKYADRHAAVTKFLEGLNLSDKAAASIEAGFDDMTFIAKLNETEVDEWSKYLDLKPGFKIKLRQGVAGLRK
jgi:hypothetical protein